MSATDLKKPTEQHLRQLATLEGFINKYFEMCSEYATQEQAYEAVERMYKAHFFKSRYGSFESFKTAKNKFLKSK